MTRILHVLDHSLPLHSGYTFRTRAILKAQAAMGLEVRGITGLRHFKDGPDTEEADGITFHRTRGTASGPVGLREWREINMLADAIVAMQDLSLQIAALNHIVIDQADVANPGRGQIERSRGTEPAGADHGHA